MLFLLGCAPAVLSTDTVTDVPQETSADTDTGTAPQDTPDTDTSDTSDVIDTIDGGWDEAWIFDPDVLHTLEISIASDDIARLRETDAYSAGEVIYVPADIRYDGESVEQVGVKLKGRWGSWRSLDAKAAFKIDMNRYVSGQTFYGLKALTLNNMVIDCSYMREHIAYQVYRAGGSPAPRTAYTRVSVNGVDYGLYLNVETPDDVFLDRHFGGGGKLYDADYKLWDDGSYTVLDFYTELIAYFDQEEGDEGDRDELYALAELLDEVEYTAEAYTATAGLVDWPSHHRMMANELWTGQIDGYSLNRNNYLAYFRDGQVRVLPWDHDYAFLEESSWGFSWQYPQGRLSYLCVNNAACTEALKEHIQEVLDIVDDMDVVDRIDDTADWLESEISTDPRRECSTGYVNYYQNELRSWVWWRSNDLRQDWGL